MIIFPNKAEVLHRIGKYLVAYETGKLAVSVLRKHRKECINACAQDNQGKLIAASFGDPKAII